MQHPVAIAIVVPVSFVGCFINTSILLSLAVWIFFLVFLTRKELLSLHCKFLGYTVLPIFFALILVWNFSITDPPIIPVDYFGTPSIGYSVLVAFRVATAGALVQLMFVPVFREGNIPSLLSAWKAGPWMVQITMSSIALLDDIGRKTRTIKEARMARGLDAKSHWGQLVTLPLLLRPIFFSSLISAIKRSELWEHRGIDPFSLTKGNVRSYDWALMDALNISLALTFFIFTLAIRIYVR